jgi:hypothetical protein
MNAFQERLTRAASDLGLRADIDFALTLPGGRTLVAEVLFPELGNPRGTLVFRSYEGIGAAERGEIKSLGYGMSVFGDPSPKVAYDPSNYAVMFADWGWNGSAETKPEWMALLHEAEEDEEPDEE